MRYLNTMALAAALLMAGASTASHAATEAAASKQDGSSPASAVVIKAADELTGIRAEYDWIAARYPGFRRDRQAVLNSGGRLYDAIDVTTAAGEHKTFYFDVTQFFGKM